jgi:hypothetical protein
MNSVVLAHEPSGFAWSYMARKVRDGTVLIWGPTGAGIVLHRLAPGVVYLTGIRNFDGPFEDGPMSDFDREIATHGSVELFFDIRQVERGSRKSREPWKEWATRNGKRHRSHLLVRSSLLHMAISVITLASGTVANSYVDEGLFLDALKQRVAGVRGLPAVPAWVTEILDTENAGQPRAR